MFLYEAAPWYVYMMWFVVLGALIAANELSRLNKWTGVVCFIVLPLILTVFVWPRTAGAGSSTGTWFHWVKVYSALAGCLGFMVLRYTPRLQSNKWMLLFPPFILSLNILEAVIRDFQCSGFEGVVDGVFMNGGPWNIMNGVAGLINIITLTGWLGIKISRDRTRDMIWADQIWPWIIAYDVWNFAYVYNCVGDHSFYAGAALLISCTVPAFFIKKGAWLQHRAHTLAFWMMFTMAFPAFVTSSQFSIKSTHTDAALLTVSVISLTVNVAVLAYEVITIKRTRRNPLREELYGETSAYHDALRRSNLIDV